MGGDARQDHPLTVLVDPNWNFQQENFEIDRFFEEARITEESITVLRSRFQKFCSRDPVIGGEESREFSLTVEDFRRLNKNYSICRPDEVPRYFSAMDRAGRRQLSFDDFLLGCAAANPASPHILNSFTGFVRARYIFDFYNVSRSGSLDFEELAKLLSDTRRARGWADEDLDSQRSHATEIAQELGELRAVTLRVVGSSGPLCDFRASLRWTGLQVRREIARAMQLPVEGQELVIDEELFSETDVLEKFLQGVVEPCVGSLTVSVATSWEKWPCRQGPQLSDGMLGVERLVHVSFDAFYRALKAEQLRGTSRLFRFHRQILQARSKALAPAVPTPAAVAAAVGGA